MLHDLHDRLCSLCPLHCHSRCRYPIQAIGPAHHANLHGALSLSVQGGEATVGVAVTAEHPQAVVTLERRGGAAEAEAGAAAAATQVELLLQETAALGPANPLVKRVALPPGCAAHDLTLRVLSAPAEADGRCLLEYSPSRPAVEGEQQVPDPATEPPAPRDVPSVDELYLTGVLHLCVGRCGMLDMGRCARPLCTAQARCPHVSVCSTSAFCLLTSPSFFSHRPALGAGFHSTCSLRLLVAAGSSTPGFPSFRAPPHTGLHLEQYRHPTRDPCLYWKEGLARDPGDARCNTALGKVGTHQQHRWC